MIETKILTLSNYNRYVETISLLNTMVFEELYRLYYNYEFKQAPYEYYNADYVISPRDRENHPEYFGKVKPLAIDLCDKWSGKLISAHIQDEGYIKDIKWLEHNIIHARDMVELVWYSMQLQCVVHEYSRMQREAI